MEFNRNQEQQKKEIELISESSNDSFEDMKLELLNFHP